MVPGAPLVSVIIVNHNGREFVEACLCSVLASDYPDFEVIFVDNASTDASLAYVRDTFGSDQRMRFMENAGSFGPAVGRNNGAAIARGKYLVFLDNDTKVAVNCLKELVRPFEQDQNIGAAQAKLLRMGTPNFDCAGDYLGPLGFLIERSRGATDTGQFDFIADILSAKSAASIIRKELFEQIGGFDRDFYMYLEETDLSWRVWLAGYRVVFISGAVVYHAFGTAKKQFRRYYQKRWVRYFGCRNYISTLIKNLEIGNLLKILPAHISCWLVLSFSFLLKGGLIDAFYIWEGIWWNALNLPLVLRKRAVINTRIRKRPDAVFLPLVSENKGIAYYVGKAFSYLTGGLY
jgi:GT2 family glycosyltransferase